MPGVEVLGAEDLVEVQGVDALPGSILLELFHGPSVRTLFHPSCEGDVEVVDLLRSVLQLALRTRWAAYSEAVPHNLSLTDCAGCSLSSAVADFGCH